MRIAELTSYIVRLPFRKEFKHASHTRRTSDNFVVRCRLRDGTQGWGEGVPRSYVTGETPDGAMDQLAATPLGEQLDVDCENWSDVLQLCSRYEPRMKEEDPRACRANAHRCAVELSILDAFGRLFGQPVSAVTQAYGPADAVRASTARVQYSGGVTSAGPRKEALRALTMRLYGFRHCKVKVGMPACDDCERLQRIRTWIGPRMDIRIDANEAWGALEVVDRLEPLIPHAISCVEQPVRHEEVEALADVRRRVAIPVMLDESLTSLVDAEAAVSRGTCDLFNIRLSKCGGFLASLRLASLAASAGLGYQLGCHPGETGILSAAGRHFVTSVGKILYREGSFDRHLLKHRLTNEDITFGYGGWAPALTGPGLGVTVNQDQLDRLAIKSQSHAVE